MQNWKAVVIHGSLGGPEENWFPWLKTELEGLGVRVFTPQFPTPQGQHLKKWLSILDDTVAKYYDNLLLIGHSIGCALILRKIEHLRQGVGAAFLVGGVFSQLGNADFDALNDSFIHDSFDWRRIKNFCSRFFVYNGDNDPYTPVEDGLRLANILGAQFRVVQGGGHINQAAGFVQFDYLLEDIRSVMY